MKERASKWTKDLQRHAHGSAFLQRISMTREGQARQRHRVETELAAVRLSLDQLASKHPEGFDAEHTLAEDYHLWAWCITRENALVHQLRRIVRQRIVE